MTLNDSRVLIIGGTSGIGLAVAKAAASRGATPIVVSRKQANVRALGDGKTYVFKVETGQPWSYIQRFSTQAGVRRAYDLPVGGFQPVNMFLDPVASAPPLDPSMISRVGIYILDKQEGPFQLVVSAIDTSR
jgi:NADPH:quinone reductase-like Zn-dependent oxidoreductase